MIAERASDLIKSTWLHVVDKSKDDGPKPEMKAPSRVEQAEPGVQDLSQKDELWH